MNIANVEERAVSRVSSKASSEWWFVIGITVFVLVITTIPYLYAHYSAPADKQFMGIMVNVSDHMQYFSWMRELSQANLSANKLTPEPNTPIFFNLLWWGLGRLGQLLGLSYAGVFQLLRIVSTTLFFLLAYRMCAWFLADLSMRRTAFLLIAFAGGFGWFLILLKYTIAGGQTPYPLLVFISEPNTFFNILAFPHFIAAALYIFVFDLLLRGQAKSQLRYAFAAGFVALFFGWQHAYDLVLVYGILGFYGLLMLLRDRHIPRYLLKSGLIIGLISWWPALYSVLLTSLDPLWEEVLAQFANAGVYTPLPWFLPILLGPTFLLALFVVIKENPFRLKGLDDNTLFIKAWFWANFLLIYIPTDYQIHMLNGWQMPISILATLGLFRYVIPFVQKRVSWSVKTVQRSVVIGFILLVIPLNIYLWVWRFIDLSRHDYPYFLHTQELGALNWLEANTQPDDVVLSSEIIGQYVPAFTGAHAFLAHWAQTIDYFNKRQMVEQFFLQTTDNAIRQKILQQYSVDYIFYGPVEQGVSDYKVQELPFLEQVFQSADVTIYRVTQ